MAWNGGRFGEEGEERGLELSLGLPAYFSGAPSPPAQPGLEGKSRASAAAAGANGSCGGFKGRPAGPVVGWPPVRSFRRNLASSSSKPSSQGDRVDDGAGGKAAAAAAVGGQRGHFVKVNVDGVPIGRKVDLAAHGSYGELSAAVDRLFRGLLVAARRDPATATGVSCCTGILDGGSGGEYALVYEDDEGDQMLVGDVPWNMFIAAAKRLRVLRSSDMNASSLRLRSASRKRAAAE
ncbi:auxin-responsive protein IAA16-like isoform X2 [Oryza brachyantha]|uniref:Auxin-responsive protein n=1 Tax=Oryza brachyantha TaxID=4533 RepID=J3M4L6_ORYBR|nr:auxin-responsive protein IAA16-like isoform X2 [Oryza brachyantha]